MYAGTLSVCYVCVMVVSASWMGVLRVHISHLLLPISTHSSQLTNPTHIRTPIQTGCIMADNESQTLLSKSPAPKASAIVRVGAYFLFL